MESVKSIENRVEARSGFEPLNKGFADLIHDKGNHMKTKRDDDSCDVVGPDSGQFPMPPTDPRPADADAALVERCAEQHERARKAGFTWSEVGVYEHGELVRLAREALALREDRDRLLRELAKRDGPPVWNIKGTAMGDAFEKHIAHRKKDAARREGDRAT